MTVHGSVVRLRAGAYEAQVAQVGATLLSLTRNGRHLVHPVAPGVLDDAWQGRTLVPWPNRVVGGRYAVAGTAYQLPVNEAATGAALHGLAAFQRWDSSALEPDRVVWVLDLPASHGYPFEVRCRVTYALDPDAGLSVRVEGENQGARPAPFGASTHPYLTCDGRPLDECTLTLPAGSVLLTDDHLSPTRVVPVGGTALDLRSPTPLRGVRLDHAFTALPATWAAELTHPTGGGVRLTSQAPWVQVYSGERLDRRGAAVEPMTCPPDAFNRDPHGVLLEPGATRTLSLQITATEHPARP